MNPAVQATFGSLTTFHTSRGAASFDFQLEFAGCPVVVLVVLAVLAQPPPPPESSTASQRLHPLGQTKPHNQPAALSCLDPVLLSCLVCCCCRSGSCRLNSIDIDRHLAPDSCQHLDLHSQRCVGAFQSTPRTGIE